MHSLETLERLNRKAAQHELASRYGMLRRVQYLAGRAGRWRLLAPLQRSLARVGRALLNLS